MVGIEGANVVVIVDVAMIVLGSMLCCAVLFVDISGGRAISNLARTRRSLRRRRRCRRRLWSKSGSLGDGFCTHFASRVAC